MLDSGHRQFNSEDVDSIVINERDGKMEESDVALMGKKRQGEASEGRAGGSSQSPEGGL